MILYDMQPHYDNYPTVSVWAEEVRNFGGRDPAAGYLKECQCFSQDLPIEGLGPVAKKPGRLAAVDICWVSINGFCYVLMDVDSW